MFRLANGTYYMISSHLSGWDPNPLIAWRSRGTQLDNASWDNLGNPTQDPTSFNTQPAYVVEYKPAQGAPYFVYLSDDWVHCGPAGLPDACYTWCAARVESRHRSRSFTHLTLLCPVIARLPIRLDDTSALPVRIDWRASWDLDDPFGHARAK